LENRLDKLSKISSWTFISFVNQELSPIIFVGSVALGWPELVVGGLVRAGGQWSGPSWWSVVWSELVVDGLVQAGGQILPPLHVFC
jgi:hypothetical protein